MPEKQTGVYVQGNLEAVVETQKALADRLFPAVKRTNEDETELRNIPPEQRRLHTETADLTVASLHQYMANAKIEIPEFQRGYVWTRTQASRLIESLIIQCPIPVVYFSQSPENNLIVIDGNQRLLSIKLFMNDAYELQGLTTYPELNGNSWSSLDPRFRDHIANRTIRCITILKDTHPQIKFDVFERLNTGSVKLNAQELRHGLNHGHMMKMLDELTHYEKWKAATGIRSDKRMKGTELILRFFALSERRSTYEKPLSSFLDRYSSERKNLSEGEASSMSEHFKKVIDRISFALGKRAFRFLGTDHEIGSPFNAAVYDAEMIGFSETENPLIVQGNYDPGSLVLHLEKLFSEERFQNAVRRATSDEQSVKTRIEMFLGQLNSFKDGL